MELLEKLKHKLASTLTLGACGHILGGSIIGTLVALPFIFLGLVLLSFVSAYSAYLILLIVLISLCIFVQGVLYLDHDLVSPPQVMIDKVFGLLIAFFGFSLSVQHWKLYAFGFCLFHFFLFVEPILSIGKGQWRISRLPGALGIMLDDVFCGVLVNILLHFAFLLSSGN